MAIIIIIIIALNSVTLALLLKLDIIINGRSSSNDQLRLPQWDAISFSSVLNYYVHVYTKLII